MAQTAETNVGALISLTPPEQGGIYWTAKQIEISRNLPNNPNVQIPISWSLGPIKITGTIDTSTFALTVSIDVVGINLGTITGNLKDGIAVKIDILVANGSIKFYLKNGNELWIHLDVKILFDGSFTGDYKIISF